jgi:hypothetical protein
VREAQLGECAFAISHRRVHIGGIPAQPRGVIEERNAFEVNGRAHESFGRLRVRVAPPEEKRIGGVGPRHAEPMLHLAGVASQARGVLRHAIEIPDENRRFANAGHEAMDRPREVSAPIGDGEPLLANANGAGVVTLGEEPGRAASVRGNDRVQVGVGARGIVRAGEFPAFVEALFRRGEFIARDENQPLPDQQTREQRALGGASRDTDRAIGEGDAVGPLPRRRGVLDGDFTGPRSQHR